MALEEDMKQFWASIHGLEGETNKLVALVKNVKIESVAQAVELQNVSAQYISNTTIAVDEALFWIRRLNQHLEKMQR